MEYNLECLERFAALSPSLKNSLGTGPAYIKTKELEAKYGVTLSFVIILLAIDELEPEDVADYLKIKSKLAPGKAKEVADHLIQEVYQPVIDELLPIGGEDVVAVANTPRYSAPELLEIFDHSLLSTIKAGGQEAADVNVSVIFETNKEATFENKLIAKLYANKEEVSSKSLEIEGRLLPATIGNVLKDFISLKGSDMPDELKIAEYLSLAPNIKGFSREEKDLLRKVLGLYRNLVFFPDSFEGEPGENWQIIPYERAEKPASVKKINDVLSDRPSAAKKTAMPKEEKSLPVAAEQVSLEEMEKELLKYDSSTLEYRAISQEIARLKKKLKK
jgi:hypothetical protein